MCYLDRVALQVSIGQFDDGGVPGFAREDLVLDFDVRLNAIGAEGAVTWRVLDAPTDATVSVMSAAKDMTGSGDTLTILPDYAGSYYGTATDGVTTVEWSFYAGPALGPLSWGQYFPRRIPSFREQLAHNVPDNIDLAEDGGNRDGWAREWRRWFAAINYLWARIQAMTGGFIAVMWNNAEYTVARMQCPPGYTVDGDTLIAWRGGTSGGPFTFVNDLPLVTEFYLTRLVPDRIWHLVIGVRVIYRTPAGLVGTIDRVFALDCISDFTGSASNVSIMEDPDTNTKLLPSGLNGLTCALVARASYGFATTVTRPTGVAGSVVVEWHATTVVDMGSAL